MRLLLSLRCDSVFIRCALPYHNILEPFSSRPAVEEDEFRVLDLKKTQTVKSVQKKDVSGVVRTPRADSMPINQDWSNVWPGPRTFHPASVPLPLRQGINKLGPSPSKYGNAELMKIPNFLHLTPPAVDKHCKVLKRFCTEWPKELETMEDCQHHFPFEVMHTDYCHSSPSIRNPLSRIITIKFPLSRLKLDKHAKDKFIRLVGERYDEATDMVTIVTDKCPLRKQNYDYALYLLTAVYHESWTKEEWEDEKCDADMEFYDWEKSISKDNIDSFIQLSGLNPDQIKEEVENYKKAVVSVFDEGENDYTWDKYREASLKVLLPNET